MIVKINQQRRERFKRKMEMKKKQEKKRSFNPLVRLLREDKFRKRVERKRKGKASYNRKDFSLRKIIY